MAKTITLENPLTMIRKGLAKRKISKLQNQIVERQTQIVVRQTKIEELNKKYFSTPSNVESSQEVKQVTQVTQTTENLEAKIESVKAQFGNKIIFKLNNKNGNYHADKGVIDGEFIKVAEGTKLTTVSTLKGKTRVFVNNPTPMKKTQVAKYFAKRGFEVEFN